LISGTGNVLKIQQMLHICTETADKDDESTDKNEKEKKKDGKDSSDSGSSSSSKSKKDDSKSKVGFIWKIRNFTGYAVRVI